MTDAQARSDLNLDNTAQLSDTENTAVKYKLVPIQATCNTQCFSLFNAPLVGNITESIQQWIGDEGLHMAEVAEAWHSAADNLNLTARLPPNNS